MIRYAFSVCIFFIISLNAFLSGSAEDVLLPPEVKEYIEVIGNVPEERSVQTVSVVTRENMLNFRFNNLKSALASLPGILILSNGSFGQSASTFIRGSASTHVLLLVDGIKIRDASNIGGVSLSTISPFLIEKIEVVRGPLSSIYGSDAIGGVISIDTGTEKGIHFETSIGNYGSYLGNVSYSKRAGIFDLSFASANQYYKGSADNDDFRNHGFKLKADIMLDTLRTGVRLFGNLTDSGIPVNLMKPSPERRYDQLNYTVAVPFLLDLNDKTELKINLSHNKNDYKFEDSEDLWSPYFRNTSDNTELEAMISAEISAGLNVNAGIDFSSRSIFTENDMGITIDHFRSDYFSSFTMLNYETGSLFLSGSLRYDKYKDVTPHISPQIGFSLLIGNRLKIKGSYSGSFMAPLPVHQLNPWGIPNFKLEPEKAGSIETGIKLFLKNLTAGITFFRTEYSNLIDWVITDYTTWAGQYQNINSADIEGVEVDFRYSPLKNLDLGFSYTYLETMNRITAEPLPRRPKNTLAFSFTWRIKTATLSGMMRYVGHRPDFDYTSYPYDIDNPSFNTYDLSAVIPLSSPVSLFIKITNLSDNTYQEFFGYPSPGRRFEAGISYRK